jgi:DNA invertase Pin-like site-specific DNA recombinase
VRQVHTTILSGEGVMSKRRIGISYGRLSEPRQTKGDGEARQDRDFVNFCRQQNLTPLAEKYMDRGLSAYKADHKKRGDFGRLIEAARHGGLEKGSVVVVERWDRLSRRRPDLAIEDIKELLTCGVAIGVAALGDIFELSDFGSSKWMTLSAFVYLAHQESLQKSQRVCASWESRRKAAREQGKAIRGRLPGWLTLADGQWAVKPGAAAALERIFQMAADGYGWSRIAGALTAGKVPTFGPSGKWSCHYVNKLLNDERVCGRYQPRKADRSPAGGPIDDYYPAIITPEQFALARAGQDSRFKGRQPRDRKFVNVFRSLLVNALDPGDSFALHNYGSAGKVRLSLANLAGMDGRGKLQTIPYPEFEAGILSRLAEVRPEDVLPRQADEVSRLDRLRAELAAARSQITALKADLKRGYSRHLADLLREAEQEETSVAGRLQDELTASARPAEKAWQQLPDLVSLVATQGDDARLRIRTVLQSIVQGARLLLVRRGSRTLAACQFFFHGGAVRSWLLLYQSGGHNRERRLWPPESFAGAGIDDDDLDLRKVEHARRLESWLVSIDPAALIDLLSQPAGG